MTSGPGLAGSLLVGINFAKALAYVHDRPLVGVNHLEGHLYAAWLADPDGPERPEPPSRRSRSSSPVATRSSRRRRRISTTELLGQTVDDAAGEAFDKVGRLLGLPYPGGPAIPRAAETATRRDVRFPRAWLPGTSDFSFSGLKTAARRIVAAARADGGTPDPDDPEARALRRRRSPSSRGASRTRSWTCSRRRRSAPRSELGAASIVLGGGVAVERGAPGADRRRGGGAAGSRSWCPSPSLCTDNGAMIGAAGAAPVRRR